MLEHTLKSEKQEFYGIYSRKSLSRHQPSFERICTESGLTLVSVVLHGEVTDKAKISVALSQLENGWGSLGKQLDSPVI